MHRDQDRIIKDRRHKPYKVDDQVWLEGTNLKMPYETAKLSPKWYRPFRVAAKISNTSYQIDLPPTWKIHPVFHATLLTPYKETEIHGPNFLEPPPDIIEGEPEWEVEKILAERKYRNRRQYLIRWKNYSPAHDSWTNESDIHADELIKQYQDSNQTTNTTRKGRGKTKGKTYIRTIRIDEETSSTSPHKHMSLPLSPSIQINSEENALLQPLTPSQSISYVPRTPSPASSYHEPASRNPFHGLPLSTAGESAARHPNVSRDVGGDGPYPDEYELRSTNELLDTWRLCQGALYYFRMERVLPDVLRAYAAQLFSMATNEGPLKSLEEAECKVDSYGAVIGALHTYRVELVDYVPDDEYLIGQAHPELRNLSRRSPLQEDEVLQQSSPTPSDTTAAILLQ